MADTDISNSHSEEITRYEHVRKNVGAKRVILSGYDPDTDTVLSIKATINPDGSYSLGTNLKSGAQIKFASINTSSSGDTQIVASVTAKKIKILSAVIVASGSVSVKWRSASTDKSGAMPLSQNSGFVLPASAPGMGHYVETNAGEALNINLSGAVQVSGHISYYEEA